MKTGAYLGIDPGKYGAAALWTEDNKVALYDFDNVHGAAEVVKKWAQRRLIRLCALERVWAMPRDGKVSAFKFGANWGVWRGILESFDIPVVEPTPTEWKKSIPPLPAANKKAMAVAWCIECFPGAEVHLKRKLDHGRAEALLLARYARDWDRLNINRVA